MTEKPLGAVGGFIVLAMVVAAVFANVIAPYSFSETHYSDAISSPGGSYLLGTDTLGRDLLSRISFGATVPSATRTATEPTSGAPLNDRVWWRSYC